MSFYFKLFAIISLILLIGITPTLSFSQAINSPRQQIENGVSSENVICNESLKLMIRPNSKPACVDKNNFIKLESWGWIVRLTTDINKLNGLNWMEPENRNLGFRNMDKLVPFPHEISKGSGPVHEFGSDPHDLSKIIVEYFDRDITFEEYLLRSHTDAILVLKGNDIVYEDYFGM